MGPKMHGKPYNSFLHQQIGNICLMNNNASSIEHTEAIEWAMKALEQTELNMTVVAQTYWSTVLKISAQQGFVYLKKTPPNLFIEVDVLQHCRNLSRIDDIPKVMALNKDLNCFLMTECGDASLRTIFDGYLNIALLVQGLKVYQRMQRATAPHVNAFLQAGVPDWRLEIFSKLYQDFINNREFLETHGLESMQIQILQNAVRKVEALCKELSNYGIPECLNHTDFHENNMVFCRATKKISIIDLGETAITHPLFSLVAFLKIPGGRYNLALDSTDYQKLYEACFRDWLLSREILQRALVVTEKLLPIYFLFAQKRFLDAIDLPYNTDNPISVKQHDKINKSLISLVDNMQAKL